MKKIWSIQSDEHLVGMPASMDGMVVYASGSGKIAAVSLGDGRVIWKQFLSPMFTTPTLSRDHVFCGTENGVHCLDRATGAAQWSTSLDGGVTTSVVPNGRLVYAGTDNGSFYALDPASGKIIWQATTKSHLRKEISCDPAFGNRQVVFGSNNYDVYCVSADTGEKLWTFGTAFWVQTSPCIVDGIVYVASHSDMCAINLLDGSMSWKYEDYGMGEILGGAAATKEALVFGGSAGVVCCLNRRDGTKRWRIRLSAPVVVVPSICSGKVFVGSHDDRVHCIDLAIGQIDWSIEADDPSSCALVDDKLLFIDCEGHRGGGRLSCFESGVQGPREWTMPRRNAEGTSSVED